MALLFLDSFDDRYFTTGSSYASYHSKWSVVNEDSSGGYLLEQVTGRTGKACKLGGNSSLTKNYSVDLLYNNLIWGMALKVESAPVSDTEIVNIEITHAGGVDNYIYKLTTDLDIKIYQNTNYIGMTEPDDSIQTNIFYYIESLINAPSSVSIQIKKNGSNWLDNNVSEVSPSGVTYVEATVTGITFKGGVIIDDLYLATTNYLGQIQIDAIVPNANTSLSRSNPWTASYLNIDECYQANHDGTTTYDTSNTASPSSVSYNFADKSSATILGLQSLSWVAAKKLSGSPGNITFSALTNISSTDYEYATTKALTPDTGPTFSLLIGLWENNPATSSAWTTSTYNSAEFGVKSSGHVSGLSAGYLTASTIELAYIPIASNARYFIIS